MLISYDLYSKVNQSIKDLKQARDYATFRCFTRNSQPIFFSSLYSLFVFFELFYLVFFFCSGACDPFHSKIENTALFVLRVICC